MSPGSVRTSGPPTGLGTCRSLGDVFGSLTVTENLQMGGYRLAPDVTAERLADIFDRFPALAKLRKRFAQTLSGGGGSCLRSPAPWWRSPPC